MAVPELESVSRLAAFILQRAMAIPILFVAGVIQLLYIRFLFAVFAVAHS